MVSPSNVQGCIGSIARDEGWFETLMQEVREIEQAFREEQAVATEQLLKKQRQLIHDVLIKGSAPAITQSQLPATSEQALQRLNGRHAEAGDELSWNNDSSGVMSCDASDDSSSSRRIQPRNSVQRCLLPIVSSTAFEVITAILVICYSTLLGIQVHLDMTELLGTKANIPDVVVNHLEEVVSFLVISYVIEIGLRLAAEQRDFFCGPNSRWNLFDCVILVISVLDLMVVHSSEDTSVELFSRFRVLRVLRFFRNFRILTLFRFFTDLRLMLWSVVCCMQSFVWGMVLLCVTFYVFCLFLEDSASVMLKHLLDEQEALGQNVSKELDQKIDDIRSGLITYWDGVCNGMLSLIFSISGGDDWANIGAPFFKMNVLYGCLFTAFVLLSLFGMLNVLVGMFVQKAGDIELWDRDLALLATDIHHENKIATYKKLFQEIDTDRSGSISLAELRRRLAGPTSDGRNGRIKSYFRHLGIDIDTAASEILSALDANGDGVLSLEEFVSGCRKLQGSAKAADMEKLAIKVDRLTRMLQSSSAGRSRAGTPRAT